MSLGFGGSYCIEAVGIWHDLMVSDITPYIVHIVASDKIAVPHEDSELYE